MNKLFIALIVVLLGVGAGWYFMKGNTQTKPMVPTDDVILTTPATDVMTGEETPATAAGDALDKGTESMEKVVVVYSDTGFSPAAVTVKKGTTVTYTNTSTSGMWVASAVHPTHQLLPGFDQLTSSAKGTSYNYTFEKIGTWKYHNHVAPSFTGNVVVTE